MGKVVKKTINWLGNALCFCAVIAAGNAFASAITFDKSKQGPYWYFDALEMPIHGPVKQIVETIGYFDKQGELVKSPDSKTYSFGRSGKLEVVDHKWLAGVNTVKLFWKGNLLSKVVISVQPAEGMSAQSLGSPSESVYDYDADGCLISVSVREAQGKPELKRYKCVKDGATTRRTNLKGPNDDYAEFDEKGRVTLTRFVGTAMFTPGLKGVYSAGSDENRVSYRTLSNGVLLITEDNFIDGKKHSTRAQGFFGESDGWAGFLAISDNNIYQYSLDDYRNWIEQSEYSWPADGKRYEAKDLRGYTYRTISYYPK